MSTIWRETGLEKVSTPWLYSIVDTHTHTFSMQYELVRVHSIHPMWLVRRSRCLAEKQINDLVLFSSD